MATPIRLGAEKSVIPPSEDNVTVAESSKVGAEQPGTKMGENDATKNKKKLTYRDQIRVAIQVRRIYSDRMVYVETKVDIKGKLLLEELKRIHGDTRGVFLGDTSSTVFPELLYWSRIELIERREALHTDETNETRLESIAELDVALQFIDEEYGDLILNVTQLLKEKKMMFHNLWTILAPNTLIYHKDALGNDRISRLESSRMAQGEGGSRFQEISANHMDSDGVRLGIVKERLQIPQFEGALPIYELPVYPVEFHADRKTLHAELLKRGEIQLCFHGTGHQLREHTGFGLRMGRDSIVKFKTHGRLIIDAATYDEMEPEATMVPDVKEAMQSEPSEKFQKLAFGYVMSKNRKEKDHTNGEPSLSSALHIPPPAGSRSHSRVGRSSRRIHESDYVNDESSDDEHVSQGRTFYQKHEMSDILKVMLSGKLYGFSLGDSTWGTFSVSRVQKPCWDPHVWASLVMKPRQKELLERLIKSHGNDESGFDDIIKGKGKGLVGLLLGPPGVGKTLTAEAVAEISKLPLFVMSCGALGSVASEINRALRKFLELATRWGAVLLLDEADVYLAKRNENDLERNAIISVFLRELEYYTGIMILTTNRARHIDSAFQSRIQFCHHYHRHDSTSRKKIWRTFVDSSRKNRKVKVDIDEQGFNKLAALRLNGREIKNAMSLAVSLAVSDPKNNCLRAEEIIDISTLLQNFDFVDEDEQENKDDEEDNQDQDYKEAKGHKANEEDREDRENETPECQPCPVLQVDPAPPGIVCKVPDKGKTRKTGIRKLERRDRSTGSSIAGATNSI
ncbi:hypothetical protein J4E85_010921 [Alternaria conjuncta]|uniref:uncharacterized protein n=1 Tax=Alternaria conjuncta TaxID=181017 RepID=UPI00221FF816|nr:uncharacterized protein J4E85_010921 [Alternaria conjuncta]KAI4913188.1 hypothetical protein J4E85_010921 [Alternaria conjuncta]